MKVTVIERNAFGGTCVVGWPRRCARLRPAFRSVTRGKSHPCPPLGMRATTRPLRASKSEVINNCLLPSANAHLSSYHFKRLMKTAGCLMERVFTEPVLPLLTARGGVLNAHLGDGHRWLHASIPRSPGVSLARSSGVAG